MKFFLIVCFLNTFAVNLGGVDVISADPFGISAPPAATTSSAPPAAPVATTASTSTLTPAPTSTLGPASAPASAPFLTKDELSSLKLSASFFIMIDLISFGMQLAYALECATPNYRDWLISTICPLTFLVLFSSGIFIKTGQPDCSSLIKFLLVVGLDLAQRSMFIMVRKNQSGGCRGFRTLLFVLNYVLFVMLNLAIGIYICIEKCKR